MPTRPTSRRSGPSCRSSARGRACPTQIGKLAGAFSHQRVIFTNIQPAVIVATEAIENPMLFEPLLADVIALDLATRIVLPLTKKRDLLAQISQSRQLAFNEAITVSLQRGGL